MSKWIFIESDEPSLEDNEYHLIDTNIYIQDCKSYTGFYVVNVVGEDYVQEIGMAKTLKEAKSIGEKTCTFS